MKRRSAFTFEKRKSPRPFGRRSWQLTSIRVDRTRNDKLIIAFQGQFYSGVIRVSTGGVTLLRDRKQRFLDWDKVAEALQKFNARA